MIQVTVEVREGAVSRRVRITAPSIERALVDLLTGVAEKEPVGAADSELEARIRTLQADLNVIYSESLGGSGGGDDLANLCPAGGDD